MSKKVKLFIFVMLMAAVLFSALSCNNTSSLQPVFTPAPPGEFNKGKVQYKKEVTNTIIQTFDKNKLGKIIGENDEGVEKLFSADFEDGDTSCDGNAAVRDKNLTKIKDGVLYIPMDEEKNPPIGTDKDWTVWSPTTEANVADYVQVQFSADMEFRSKGSGAWMACFIGCFVSNYNGIPDNPGNGIWFSFNEKTNKINVYGGAKGVYKWPEGIASVSLPKDIFKEKAAVDIICTENYEIYVYINKEIRCSVKCGDDIITVYNEKNEKIFSGECDMTDIDGGYFSIFSHEGGAGVDNMKIYGCSKGECKTETTVTATPLEGYSLGLDITDRNDVVSICYSMWFDAINGSGTGEIKNIANVSEMIEKYGFSAEYGFGTKDEQHNAVTKFHYWAEPEQGYYRSTDKSAIRNNMTLLYNAGVDFIILDYTYASAGGYSPGTGPWASYIYGPSTALLDTIMEMRADGLGTPYVVFWMNSDDLFNDIWDNFYGVEKWKDCFVYWNNKPFILRWEYENKEYDKYTVRGMYGLRGKAGENQWSYLEINNKNTVSYDKNNKPEQVCAVVATQETYMSLPTAHGRDGGKFWNSQWQTVFKIKPKIVTVTWWNEWCAQLYKVDGVGYIFTDNFNQEYSRDIEPMKGGHGDQYYKWLCQYISDYRSGKSCPKLYNK